MNNTPPGEVVRHVIPKTEYERSSVIFVNFRFRARVFVLILAVKQATAHFFKAVKLILEWHFAHSVKECLAAVPTHKFDQI